MRILMLSSEVTPFAKTGGLADVAAALPRALVKNGHDVRIMMPLYQQVDRFKHRLLPISRRLSMDWGSEKLNGELMRCSFPVDEDIPVYFIQHNMLFGRNGIYGEANRDYPDNDRRFSFLNYAGLRALQALDWKPDVIHVNDWQTGLVPVFLKNHPHFVNDPFYRNIKTVFTIHNLAYQGLMQPEIVSQLSLPWSVFTEKGMEFYKKASLLKAGIVFSDHVTTVSPTYSREIQTEEFGGGLEGILQQRQEKLSGICNGIDTEIWNPKTDEFLVANYSAENPAGKKKCKKDLIEISKLNSKKDKPLIGLISRLVDQKGLDIIEECLPKFVENDCQFVLLGSGSPKYEKFFKDLAKKYPDHVAITIGFDDELAHKIEAGSDIFLMPSAFEPCGLNQMYSMHYGTVPLVRKTGGLADTVVDVTDKAIKDGSATGFVFEEYTAEALEACIQRAIDLYNKDQKAWHKLMNNGMTKDFSWLNSAKEYEEVYERIMSGK